MLARAPNIPYANLISLQSLRDWDGCFFFILPSFFQIDRRQSVDDSTEATSTVNITRVLAYFSQKFASSRYYIYMHVYIYIALLPFSFSPSPVIWHPRCFSNFLELVPRKVNLLYAPCAKQIRPLSARQTRDCLNHRARERAEKGLRRMKSADITKICL